MSTLNDLMDLDPLQLTAEDIDAIIDYHRKNRGVKVTKDTGPAPKIDLAKLGMVAKAAPEPIKRRV